MTNTPQQYSAGLKKLVGKRVAELIRYSWWPKDEMSRECGTPEESGLSLTAGPLAVIFDDGTILGVTSDPTLNSIIVWDESQRTACDSGYVPLSDDLELHPIRASDQASVGNEWLQFLNRRLIGFSILKKKSMTALENEVPSELGLCFVFEGDVMFIAAHGLHDGSDDFSVLLSGSIAPSLRGTLVEIPLGSRKKETQLQ